MLHTIALFSLCIFFIRQSSKNPDFFFLNASRMDPTANQELSRLLSQSERSQTPGSFARRCARGCGRSAQHLGTMECVEQPRHPLTSLNIQEWKSLTNRTPSSYPFTETRHRCPSFTKREFQDKIDGSETLFIFHFLFLFLWLLLLLLLYTAGDI